ncbi:bifunctional UDP-N-acetylmuramoyl-tripeptide:D-alanyl-D-alanine ligase/alanine racemase [Paraflavisolibacter sp. H34]|uniref:bifunctional UDP-N-acetylmuramoyl-tripeptide:D-alanyl-D-alanine ligase/alanine racemase n=1 Tax=Huijunlia imazamoxiresistens TaxID=3127457 RepID=UPI00301A461C
MYSIETICAVVDGEIVHAAAEGMISELVYDSRKVQEPASALFFALVTAHDDGHRFLSDAFARGVRRFVVSKPVDFAGFQECTLVQVADTLQALQQLAAFHRRHFQVPVIGITGSNGKTVVKEWLHQLLEGDHHIVRSPKSYNSQIGVPLSVWQMHLQHNLAIFEAGISHTGEMARLQPIIQPTIGVLTNIGEAHDAGFSSHQQKLDEKLKLFAQAEVVIGPVEWLDGSGIGRPLLTWGARKDADLQVLSMEKVPLAPGAEGTRVVARRQDQGYSFLIPFADEASLQNALNCVCVLLHLRYDEEQINRRLALLHPIDMRLQFTQGINGCGIINDSYSADITSLHLALDFLQQQGAGQQHTVILSDFVESGKTDALLYESIAQALKQHGVQRVIAIGEKIRSFLPPYMEGVQLSLFPDTAAFIQSFRSSSFSHETILIKGARVFQFERIARLFEQKVHQTLLEIDLNAIAHNLKEYQRLLRPGTKVMAMVKAFAYGSGGSEIAGVLQFNKVDYLGVAYVDEGVELRKTGVSLPIMVMNADETAFGALVEYHLQPVIYSFRLLEQFDRYLKDQGLSGHPVHIEVETGMNRLGFAATDMGALGAALSASAVRVVSMFSHFAASEDPDQDAFTLQQHAVFVKAADQLQQALPYSFLRHMANSAAIVRHPQLHLDMVRLGIGLYGVETTTDLLHLQPVATLKSTVAQLKKVQAGESVSYNRRGKVHEDSLIATIRIGYADGYSRRFGNGTGKMWVNGRLAPVIGTVCMDMTMIDVTRIPGVKEGDEVVVFGRPLPVQQVAAWIGTIPYEIMTSVSQRVKRIYFQE